jgi:hypothetical protein
LREIDKSDAGDPTVELGPPKSIVRDATAPLVAMSRLFATAALYPSTHARIVEMAAPIVEAARSADPSRPFALEVGDDDSSRDAGGRLHEELRKLGILRIELSRDVTTQDLAAFARSLRLCTVERVGPAAFRHVELAALPPSIRVFERRFADAAADAPPADDDVVGRVRRDVLAALARDGAHDVRATDAVRKWAERMSRPTARLRTPAEVLADARRTLPQALPGVDWSGVLDGIHKALDVHLRDAFRGERRVEFDGATTMDLEMAGVDQDDLVAALDDITAACPAVGHVAPADGAEALSILLHALCDQDLSTMEEHVVRRLTACFAAEFGAHELRPLVGWIRRLAERAPRDEFDLRLAQVAASLREAGRDVARVLVAACEPPYRALANAMWPHLAYELVTGDDDGRGPERQALSTLLASVPRTTLREESRRLRTLVGRGAAPIAKSVFFPPRAELFDLYEILVETPPEAGFAAVVTAAIMRRPPAHPAAGALVALTPTDERAHRFVARLLREAKSPSSALNALAVDILVESLRGLPKARRNEDWVESAVRALAELPCAASDAMLRDVRDARRLLVFRAWPPRAALAAAAPAAEAAA